MKPIVKDLGKVIIIPKGPYNATEVYEFLDLVTKDESAAYLAKKDVPAGTPLTDTNYWFELYNISGGVGPIDGDKIINDSITNEKLKARTAEYLGITGDKIGIEVILGGDGTNKGHIAPSTVRRYNINEDDVIGGNDDIINGWFV